MSKVQLSKSYRALRSFQAVTIIYDATHWFCERYLESRPRVADAMTGAARRARNNIATASKALVNSPQTELHLLNDARASLEELLLDYEDYLRHRRLQSWREDDPEAIAVRNESRSAGLEAAEIPADGGYARYAHWLDHNDAAVRANALICLIEQTNLLLDHQIATLEAQSVTHGAYSDTPVTAHLTERERPRTSKLNDETDQELIPACPKCGSPMVLRTAKKGKGAGRQFWGCTDYPACRGTAQ